VAIVDFSGLVEEVLEELAELVVVGGLFELEFLGVAQVEGELVLDTGGVVPG